MCPAKRAARLTRRQIIQAATTTLAGAAGLAAISQQPGRAAQPPGGAKPAEKLRIVTCQFPVGAGPAENAKYIRDFMRKAAAEGAHLLHTPEASLSGYAQQALPPARRPGRTVEP
jgi:hypothetical protein